MTNKGLKKLINPIAISQLYNFVKLHSVRAKIDYEAMPVL